MIKVAVTRRRNSKKAIKTDKGLKSIMSIIASEEQSNQADVSVLAAASALPLPPPSANATTISVLA